MGMKKNIVQEYFWRQDAAMCRIMRRMNACLSVTAPDQGRDWCPSCRLSTVDLPSDTLGAFHKAPRVIQREESHEPSRFPAVQRGNPRALGGRHSRSGDAGGEAEA